MCFCKHSNSVEKQLSNFRNDFLSCCFKNSLLTMIWNNYQKCMKKNLEFRKKTFQEAPFNKCSAKYSTQNDGMVERHHKCIRVRGLSFE